MLRVSFKNGHAIQQRLSNLEKNMCRVAKKAVIDNITYRTNDSYNMTH